MKFNKTVILSYKKQVDFGILNLSDYFFQPNSGGEQKKQVCANPRLNMVTSSSLLANSIISLNAVMKARAPTSLLLRLPTLKLDVTPKKQIYLSATPPRLLMKNSSTPALTLPVSNAATNTITTTSSTVPCAATTIAVNPSNQLEVTSFTLNHPKPLKVRYLLS